MEDGWASFGNSEAKETTDSKETKEVPAHILQDLVDSEEEEDEEELRKPANRVEAATSSDSESEGEPTKHGADSSETESGNEETVSEHPSPQKCVPVPAPPEDLEPKQLKRLETMRESPA